MEVCPPSVLKDQQLFKMKAKKCFRGRRAYTDAVAKGRNLTPEDKIGGSYVRNKKTKTQKRSYDKKSTRNLSAKSDTSLSSCSSCTEFEETRP